MRSARAEAGETLVREFLRDRSRGYQPAGFVDDDLEKRDREIYGVRVGSDRRFRYRRVQAAGAGLVAPAPGGFGLERPFPGKQAVHDLRYAAALYTQISQPPAGHAVKLPDSALTRVVQGNPPKDARDPSRLSFQQFHFNDLLFG